MAKPRWITAETAETGKLARTPGVTPASFTKKDKTSAGSLGKTSRLSQNLSKLRAKGVTK